VCNSTPSLFSLDYAAPGTLLAFRDDPKEISLSAPNSFIGTAAAYFTRGLLKYNFDCVRKIGRRVSLGKHMSWEISEVGDIQFCQLSQSTWS
jgi:hypothetical protein